MLDTVRNVARIRKALGHTVHMSPPIQYLDTEHPDLNAVLGREGRGIPYGALIELYGASSLGKTALGLDLAGIAQRDGAVCWWADFENSFDPEWAKARGVNLKPMYFFEQYMGMFEKERSPRLATVQEVIEEIEKVMAAVKAKAPDAKFFGVVDSLAAMLTDTEASAGITGAGGFKAQMSHPTFMGRWLRRWVSLCKSMSCTVVLINQTRTNPMQMFGNPEYTPGGNPPKFYTHVRARLSRMKKGRVMRKGKPVGILTTVTAVKSKLGSEGAKCGYRMMYSGGSSFMTIDELKEKLDAENGE